MNPSSVLSSKYILGHKPKNKFVWPSYLNNIVGKYKAPASNVIGEKYGSNLILVPSLSLEYFAMFSLSLMPQNSQKCVQVYVLFFFQFCPVWNPSIWILIHLCNFKNYKTY
jgi:hypothetical protein